MYCSIVKNIFFSQIMTRQFWVEIWNYCNNWTQHILIKVVVRRLFATWEKVNLMPRRSVRAIPRNTLSIHIVIKEQSAYLQFKKEKRKEKWNLLDFYDTPRWPDRRNRSAWRRSVPCCCCHCGHRFVTVHRKCPHTVRPSCVGGLGAHRRRRWWSLMVGSGRSGSVLSAREGRAGWGGSGGVGGDTRRRLMIISSIRGEGERAKGDSLSFSTQSLTQSHDICVCVYVWVGVCVSFVLGKIRILFAPHYQYIIISLSRPPRVR